MAEDGRAMETKLLAFAAVFPGRVSRGMRTEMEIDLTKMKQRCPVSPTLAQLRAMGRSRRRGVIPGALRASGRVIMDPIGKNPKEISGEWAFGGGSVDYAAVQHERLDFQHTTGQAKYAESVMSEERAGFAGRIGKRIHIDRGDERLAL